MTDREIMKMLPKGWHELKLKDFLKLMMIVPTEGPIAAENLFQVIGKLCNVTREALEALPMNVSLQMANRIAWITFQPEPLESLSFDLKKIEELSYKNWIILTTFQTQILQAKEIIKAISKTDLTDEQIENLPMDEVFTAFFLLRKQLEKYIKHSITFLKKQKMKQATRTLIRFRRKSKDKKKNSKKTWDGTGLEKKSATTPTNPITKSWSEN